MTMPARPAASGDTMTVQHSSSVDTGVAQILVELGTIKTTMAVMDERLKVVPDHEQRIRALEQFKYVLMGGGAIAGALAGWLASVLQHAASHHP